MMKAVSGDKTPDYKQGPVEGLLKDAGYTEEMVYKFWFIQHNKLYSPVIIEKLL